MSIPIEERTHESSFFTKTDVLNELIEKGYLRMGDAGVDPVSLAKLMNEYVLYAPSNADVIARIVGQPANLVYGKLLKHVESFESYRNAGIKCVETMHGAVYLCPLKKLEDLLFEKTSKSRQCNTPCAEKSKKENEFFQRKYSRQEVLSNIDKQRFEKLVRAGVLPDADEYCAQDVDAVLLKIRGRVLVDELLEEHVMDDKEKFEAAKARIYAALKKPEIQITYGVTDIGVKMPLYIAEKDRFSHVVKKVVDL